MAELRPGAQRLLGLFGAAQASVANRVSIGTLMDDLRAAAEAAGIDLGPLNPADVSQVRSIAVAARNATDELAAKTTDQAITAQDIWTAPWSSYVAGSLTPREYEVRVLVDFQRADGTSGSEWRTWRTAQLPATKGQLFQGIDAALTAMQDEYDEIHTGFSLPSIAGV